jgi:hypothetical protein
MRCLSKIGSRLLAGKSCRKNHQNNISKLYLVLDEADLIAGFYTLSNASINCEEVPEDIRKALPKYPIPAIRLGRMGSDLKYKGLLKGDLILQHVFEVAVEQSKYSASFVLLVDAKDEHSEKLYRDNDFMDLIVIDGSKKPYPKAMFIMIKTIENLLSQQ